MAGIASATAHLLMAFGQSSGELALLMVAMAAVCLPCAVHLGLGDARRRTAALAAVLAAGMLLAHVVLVRSVHRDAMPGMDHAGAAAAVLMHPAVMLGLPLVNFGFATAAALAPGRGE